MLSELLARVKPGSVYLGVGPEQNYTYMAAMKPKMAIIFDIRRGNLDMQLMYKAIFELSADRAAFVSMLFSRPRPAGLAAASTVGQLFTAFDASPASETLFRQNLAAIETRLTKAHTFTVRARDLDGVRTIYGMFFQRLRASRLADLCGSDDGHRRARRGAQLSGVRSQLHGPEKNLDPNNLVVPVVGDFAGPKAIRAVAAYLRPRAARRCVLPVERRAVPGAGRQVGRLLPQRRDAAAGQLEHLHPFVEWRRRRIWVRPRIRLEPRQDG